MTWDLLSHFKDIKSDLLQALNDNKETTKSDDDNNGFMDMVVSSSLKSKSSDYSRDSEDKQSKFSGSKDQGRFCHINLQIHKSMDFSKDNDSGIHTSRREGEEGFLQGWIIHCLQAKCAEEIFESHQSEPE